MPVCIPAASPKLLGWIPSPSAKNLISSRVGLCFAQQEELRKERLGAFIPGADVFFLIKPLFRLPQEGKGKQTKLDNIGGNTPYDNGVAELQKILQMCICVLIWLVQHPNLNFSI